MRSRASSRRVWWSGRTRLSTQGWRGCRCRSAVRGLGADGRVCAGAQLAALSVSVTSTVSILTASAIASSGDRPSRAALLAILVGVTRRAPCSEIRGAGHSWRRSRARSCSPCCRDCWRICAGDRSGAGDRRRAARDRGIDRGARVRDRPPVAHLGIDQRGDLYELEPGERRNLPARVTAVLLRGRLFYLTPDASATRSPRFSKCNSQHPGW